MIFISDALSFFLSLSLYFSLSPSLSLTPSLFPSGHLIFLSFSPSLSHTFCTSLFRTFSLTLSLLFTVNRHTLSHHFTANNATFRITPTFSTLLSLSPLHLPIFLISDHRTQTQTQLCHMSKNWEDYEAFFLYATFHRKNFILFFILEEWSFEKRLYDVFEGYCRYKKYHNINMKP